MMARNQQHITPASQIDPNDWGNYATGLLGAGTVGLLLREALRLIFARADRNDDNATVKRAELREQVAALTNRVDLLTSRLDEAREREHVHVAAYARLESENVALRGRYHRVLNYVQEFIGTLDEYAERLGVPQQERLRLPRWIDETIPGPTQPKPPVTPP